ncbi:glycosyltransferase family 4 protein [Geomonas edaphica]|uniref:glycosyltransferase family 4 protein n=1 Tax=Geomonas edaphica TaxID=2570226 RepID=UPI0010A8FE65|nr:glycosyltransferase family 4 protein [Geomonas edaphica]
MRILILSQWFDPEPTFKGMVFARELVRLGHDVEVLTGFPNYPGGKLYPGYRVRLLQRETVDGVSIIRVPLYPSHDGSAVRRIMNYLSFALSAAILGPFLVRRADVAYVYHPPATVALPAMALRLFRRIPFLYDVQDLWPDTLSATGMVNSRRILTCVDLFCRLTYRMASKVVVLSPGFRRMLLERGVPTGKLAMIYNWCDEAQIVSTAAGDEAPELNGRFNVIFAGTMGKAQALDAVLEAAQLLKQRQPKVQFVLVGGGIQVEHLEREKKRMGLGNVLFLPRRPVSEIGSLLSRADALLVHLKDDPLFAITLPSKTQAYLAIGRPIIMAVRGDAADLVERAGAGIPCLPGNAQSIAEAVEKLVAMDKEQLDQMGRNGAEYYQKELALPVGTRKFEELFQAVAGAGASW